MKNRIIAACALVAMGGVAACGAKAYGAKKSQINPHRQKYEVFVDSEGVMRRSDNKQEVSYYGTNYTVPFAYSYRALGYEGKDRKRAIDRDVYHLARLGLNAFRLHLWDAELADSVGNLVQSEHLDLLDYLIAQLENRGIDIVLTAQTNFGNGYPEKDADTGSFTYDYDKCDIHFDSAARAAQARYLQQLVKHRNTYTGRALADDKAVVAIEINNEPCHKASKRSVTEYIDHMSAALRKGGYKRPILYNVTHNPDVTSAYYDAKDIQGTTYQWYPTGLVAGHERKGNFLPALDNYTIPWQDTIPAYKHLARAVYEFDPADVLYSHLYPAIARTFRGKGFQWITQFAYDPIDLAQYNTEYPTHYMNLAYTPAKALSLMIAAETARETPRGANYGKYPDNTKFGHTRVSHDPDLSVFNSPQKFIYSNSTDDNPVCPDSLELVAGHGSSPVAQYDGTGAYFLDRTGQPGVWRLEIMPDADILDDPFGNTSLNDVKIVAVDRPHRIKLNLPGLRRDYTLYKVTADNEAEKVGRRADVLPGIYLVVATGIEPDMDLLMEGKIAGNLGFTEYVKPEPTRIPLALLSPKQGDVNLDVNMIPESWDFSFNYVNPNWYDPVHYKLDIRNDKPDSRTVIRRRVGDKIAKVPETVNPTQFKVAFLTMNPADSYGATDLPGADAKVSVVSRNGYTYSAPMTFVAVEPTANIPAASAVATINIKDLTPDTGVIMPAPYPVTVTREIPKTGIPLGSFRDIEFIQLNLPTRKGTYLIKDIWLE